MVIARKLIVMAKRSELLLDMPNTRTSNEGHLSNLELFDNIADPIMECLGPNLTLAVQQVNAKESGRAAGIFL